jgi:hypothetical protein
MALLGGSPLGLINVRSLPTSDGMSTFNGGTSRKISVNSYNNATGGQMNQKNGNFSGSVGTRSLFSGSPSASVAPYGNVGKLGTTNGGGMDMSGPYKGIKRSSLHNNTVYDMSLLNIIEQLSGTQAELRPSDFAYLKDVGVFPNNRLMIARRFGSPHHDNIFLKGLATGQPLAIMISWKPQGEDFLKISFGEKWEDAEADFKSVLDSLGEDFLGKTLGQRLGGAAAVIPLPGFTETIQRTVLQKMGVIDDKTVDGNLPPLPAGNPNLIKMAKRRQTVKSETAGSGLNCTVSIQMVCEWEQKFLSGIDPTIAWQDILGKILTFSTSRSNNYGLKASFEKTIKDWMDYPEHIVRDMVQFIKEGLNAAKAEIKKMIEGVKETLAPSKTKDEADKKVEADKKAALDKLKDVNENTLVDDLVKGLSRQLNKYKIVIEGIARALSGAPSTPWHITIGNPLRPIFCSGDMYMSEDLSLDLGATLAFNDLPSSIKATFTLTNARPWGLQEIAAKFNSGSIRVVTSVKDANDLNHGETLQDQIYVAPQAESTTNPTNTTAATKAVAGAAATGAVAGVAGATVPTTTAQVTPAIATVAAGPQLTPIPTFANNFNADISTALPNLTAGAATNLASAQGTLDGVTAAANSGLGQAEALAAKATAAANAAATAAGTATGGGLNGAIAGAVAAAQNAVSAAQNTVATVGANVSSTAASAVGTVKESVNSQSVVPDPNSSVGTTLQNIDWSGFTGI